jgi:hypothetical protein
MRGIAWSQLSVYAASLVISLVLSLYRPDVKDVLCTGLPAVTNGNIDNYRPVERSTSNQHSPDREK